MNKNKAIAKFCVIAVLALIGLALTFCSFVLPFSTTRFNGFYGAIEKKMGIDLAGGVLAVFECEPNGSGDLQTQMDATISRLERTLTDKGYVESTIQKQGTKIRIEIPGLEDSEAIFDAIGEPAEIEFKTHDTEETFITGEQIKSVEVVTNSDYEVAVRINFTNEGAKAFQDEAKKAYEAGEASIKIYSNGELISSPSVKSADVGAQGFADITGGYTQETAESFKMQIDAGLYEVKLSVNETSVIPPTMGKSALLVGQIAVLAALFVIFVLMVALYKDLGWLSNLSMVIYFIIFMFFLAVVDSVQLTLPGIAGIILSIGMAIDANIIIFERIKDEFKNGKRMSTAIKAGFDKSIKTILDANITTVIAGVVLYILGTGAIKGFAITLLLGVLISMFTSLVITRSFAKLYLYINNKNPKRVGLKAPKGEEAAAVVVAPKTRKLNLGGAK